MDTFVLLHERFLDNKITFTTVVGVYNTWQSAVNQAPSGTSALEWFHYSDDDQETWSAVYKNNAYYVQKHQLLIKSEENV